MIAYDKNFTLGHILPSDYFNGIQQSERQIRDYLQQCEKPLHFALLTISIILLHTCSTVIPVESTSVASSAFLSGASAR